MEWYTGRPVVVEKIRMVKSLTGEGRRKSAFLVVWICRLEVRRNGGVGTRRERVVEMLEGARVKGVKVVFVPTIVIKGI
jgi:hypothetical protein